MQGRKSFPSLSPPPTRVTEECFCGSKVMKKRTIKLKTFTVEDSRLVSIIYGSKTKKLFCLSISGEFSKNKKRKIIAKLHEKAFSSEKQPLESCMTKVNFVSCHGEWIKTEKSSNEREKEALAYINNSCSIQRYIFAAKVIIKGIFRAMCGGGEQKVFYTFPLWLETQHTFPFMFTIRDSLHTTYVMVNFLW